MVQIVSKRGREAKAEADNRQRLAEKQQLSQTPLSVEEQEQMHRVFENIKKQLADIS